MNSVIFSSLQTFLHTVHSGTVGKLKICRHFGDISKIQRLSNPFCFIISQSPTFNLFCDYFHRLMSDFKV